ncbi:hypothetical protein IEE94_12865 [Yimella sp. cx-573]|nr:hypothetical protein [Yimella sp. cx-573]
MTCPQFGRTELRCDLEGLLLDRHRAGLRPRQPVGAAEEAHLPRTVGNRLIRTRAQLDRLHRGGHLGSVALNATRQVRHVLTGAAVAAAAFANKRRTYRCNRRVCVSSKHRNISDDRAVDLCET